MNNRIIESLRFSQLMVPRFVAGAAQRRVFQERWGEVCALLQAA